MSDNVNHPSHYTNGGVECIDAIKSALGDKYIGYLWGNAMKYLWRFPHKGNAIQDLKKCEWYLSRIIEDLEDAQEAEDMMTAKQVAERLSAASKRLVQKGAFGNGA